MQDSAGPQFVLSDAQRGTETGQYQGTYGLYWSSLAYTSATSAYGLYLDGTNSAVYPADYYYKRNGFSLRCLAQ